jgi:hypothetical protein
MAMRWFATAKQMEIWEEPVVWPIGDIEAAHRIRDICRAAAASAEKARGVRGSRPEQEVRRYERALRAAMEIALKISDDLLRDSAVRQIVDLCFKADDFKTARVLFRAIQAVSIREEVMRDHPQLGS